MSLLSFDLYLSGDDALREYAKAEIEKQYTSPTPDFDDPEEDGTLLYYIDIESKENPWDVARQLLAIDGVEDVEPDLPSKGMGDTEEEEFDEDPTAEKSILSAFNKDTNKERIEEKYEGIFPAWNHKETKFKEAIDFSKIAGRLNETTQIRIAQLDTGYFTHPEGANVNEVKSYNFMTNQPDGLDPLDGGITKQPGHGFRTSSIFVGAKTQLPLDDNHGVFPYVEFVPYRISSSVIIFRQGRFLRAAIKSIKKEGIPFDIITMSMGGLPRKNFKKLAREIYEAGIIWVCAAGNRVPFVVAPAVYNGTIAVGAVDYLREIWSGSSPGKAVDICAPGHNCYVPKYLKKYEDDSGDKKYTYSYGSGTSYATPHIASAAALWLNHYKEEIKELYPLPWQKIEAFRTVLKASADRGSGWNTNKNGEGILNALDLLKEPLPSAYSLKHAYTGESEGTLKTFSLSTKKTKQSSIAEKELKFLIWNADIKERKVDYNDVLSKATTTTKGVMGFKFDVKKHEKTVSFKQEDGANLLGYLEKNWTRD